MRVISMAFDLQQLPITISNDGLITATQNLKRGLLIGYAVIMIGVDALIWKVGNHAISPEAWIAGLAVPWVMFGFPLAPFMIKKLERKSLAIDQEGIHGLKGRFHVDYGWDQLSEARYSKRIVTMGRGDVAEYYIKLIRRDRLIPGMGNVDPKVDTIENEFGDSSLEDLASLLNAAIARWGAAAEPQRA